MIDDLKIIKKKYGEEMMHFCRDAFATILETPDVLSNLLLTYFEPSKILFSDLEKENLENNFKTFIYHKHNKEEQLTITENKTPQELLSSVGYNLYECKSEEDIQKFKKYYVPGEELCTFNDDRLNDCYVFFAVKKDVKNIRRENFSNPERQDLYGTSVISIQFDRNEAHTLSIKNRYNHTVANPDATFSNNLDNIVEGLTYSFAKYYDLKQQYVNEFEIPDYTWDNRGKYYKYNYEMNGICYGPNNIIIDKHKAQKYAKERYIIADYYIIDRKEKVIRRFGKSKDAFIAMFKNVTLKKIDLEIKDNNKLVKIETSKGLVTLELDRENRIIGLTNPYIEEIGDYFLYYNKWISKINLPQVKTIGDYFLKSSRDIKELNLPNVLKLGDNFLAFNQYLKEISLPKVENIGYGFLYYNEILEKINLPNVINIGNEFLAFNTELKEISLLKVEIIGFDFLDHNKLLTKIDLPNVKKIGSNFLFNSKLLTEINMPNVLEIESGFLYYNNLLEKIHLPNVKIIGSDFLHNNEFLTEINVPNVMNIGKHFLSRNQCLEEVIINNEEVYQEFLRQHPEYQEKTLTKKLIKKGII